MYRQALTLAMILLGLSSTMRLKGCCVPEQLSLSGDIRYLGDRHSVRCSTMPEIAANRGAIDVMRLSYGCRHLVSIGLQGCTSTKI